MHDRRHLHVQFTVDATVQAVFRAAPATMS